MKWICVKTFEDESTCTYRRRGPGTRMIARSLRFKLVFECQQLDEKGAVLDSDELEPIGIWLRERHHDTTCVAEDDPDLQTFQVLYNRGFIDLRVVQGVGTAKFAEHALAYVRGWLADNPHLYRITVRSVECEEKGGSSSLCLG